MENFINEEALMGTSTEGVEETLDEDGFSEDIGDLALSDEGEDVDSVSFDGNNEYED